MFVVLFNAPPGAGKDTAALAMGSILPFRPFSHILPKRGVTLLTRKYAEPLRLAVQALYGIKISDENKDLCHPALEGRTPRQAMIELAEKCILPILGEDFFVKRMVYNLRQDYLIDEHGYDKTPLVLITDSGKPIEVSTPWWEEFIPKKNILLLRIERAGHDYINDSRCDLGEIAAENGIQVRTIQNNGTKDELGRAAIATIEDWLKGVLGA